MKTLSASEILEQTLELPCGVVLKNRIAKSPMSDSLGDGAGNPTEAQIRLYERWAEGGAALSLIGEVQGDPRYPEKPGNLVLGKTSDTDLLRQFTERATMNHSQLWVQLGHAGALSHAPISQAKGPSALALDGLHCAEMPLAEIQQLPEMYAQTALFAQQNGFSGVLIHAGHGFLLSQFLSPLFNHRNDCYGGSIAARSRIIIDIISAVREAVGKGFPIGIRINSSDMMQGGLSERDALAVVRLLDKTTVDLIDISGGTYFPGAKAASNSSGDAPYFLAFAKQARAVTDIPLMLTGGFKKRQQAVDAIVNNVVDIVNIGRAMALNPQLANTWLSEAGGDPVFPQFSHTVEGGVTAWYTMLLTAIGEDRENDFDLDLPEAVAIYEARDDARCAVWNRIFSGL